ncbi:MAG: hypothetical protein V4601_04420 [Pseudomonadota bacterium]
MTVHVAMVWWAWRGLLALILAAALFGFSLDIPWLVSVEIWLVNNVPDPILFALVAGLFLSSWQAPVRTARKTATEDSAQPRPATAALEPMSVTQIAEYLLFDSEWGWRKRLEFIKVSLVRAEVGYEMTRAGRAGAVRYCGIDRGAADPQSQDIDRAYWQQAAMADDKIFDPKRRSFAVATSDAKAPVFERGTAPKLDVQQTWPPAWSFLKVWVSVRIFCVRLRYGFPEVLQDRRTFERLTVKS